MKKILLLFCSIFLFCNAYAQETRSFRTHLQAYNYVFPGIELAYEMPVITQANKKDNQKGFQLNLAPVFDLYFYRGNHTGLSLIAEMNIKYFGKKGYTYQVFGGYGGVYEILSGEVYEMNESGAFTSSKLKGNLYSQYKFGFGFGKFVYLKSGKKAHISLRGGIREARTPGGFLVPNFSAGINWPLKPVDKSKKKEK